MEALLIGLSVALVAAGVVGIFRVRAASRADEAAYQRFLADLDATKPRRDRP